jgi:ABC-type Fe3+/spermidine/putrescine transport system ATPase subunit
VAEPRVLLFDEPLSNLDAKRREQMRGEIRTLIKRIKGTAIYITHDQIEAITIADRIICMNSGRVEQVGRPEDLYERPVNKFVAGFISDCVFVEGEIDAATRIASLPSGIKVQVGHVNQPDRSGPVTLCFRPERLQVLSEVSEPSDIPAEIVGKVYMGAVTEYTLKIGADEIRVRDRNHNHPLGSAGVRVDEGGAMALFN